MNYGSHGVCTGQRAAFGADASTRINDHAAAHEWTRLSDAVCLYLRTGKRAVPMPTGDVTVKNRTEPRGDDDGSRKKRYNDGEKYAKARMVFFNFFFFKYVTIHYFFFSWITVTRIYWPVVKLAPPGHQHPEYQFSNDDVYSVSRASRERCACTRCTQTIICALMIDTCR